MFAGAPLRSWSLSLSEVPGLECFDAAARSAFTAFAARLAISAVSLAAAFASATADDMARPPAKPWIEWGQPVGTVFTPSRLSFRGPLPRRRASLPCRGSWVEEVGGGRRTVSKPPPVSDSHRSKCGVVWVRRVPLGCSPCVWAELLLCVWAHFSPRWSNSSGLLRPADSGATFDGGETEREGRFACTPATRRKDPVT